MTHLKNTKILWTLVIVSVLCIIFFFCCLEKQDLGLVCVVREDTQVFRHHERDKRELIATLEVGEMVSVIDEIGAKGYGAFLVDLRDSNTFSCTDREIERSNCAGFIIGSCELAYQTGKERGLYVERRFPYRLIFPWQPRPMSSAEQMKKYPDEWTAGKDEGEGVQHHYITLPTKRKSEN